MSVQEIGMYRSFDDLKMAELMLQIAVTGWDQLLDEYASLSWKCIRLHILNYY